MPTPRSDCRRDHVSGFRFPQGRKLLILSGAILSLGVVLVCPAQTVTTSKQPALKKPGKFEGYAMWYKVPLNSLAKRRAGKDEFTAAHNRLPLGTKVRVTHLGNGKSVIVRITDRGIIDRHALIDLCKEAATKLGMLGEGSARVRLEILPDDKGATAVSQSKTIVAHP
jgi:rare lipoprotein A (peptidoglycan hydrolase)